jgi:hypothetical protein
MWVFGRRRDRGWVWERELVDECEAFVSGRYVQDLDGDRRSVPEWAWLNILAHSGEGDIRAIAVGGPPTNALHDATWRSALVFLAQEVLSEMTRRGGTLLDLQRSTLVPLELAFATEDICLNVQPAHVVGAVLTALAGHPSDWSS